MGNPFKKRSRRSEDVAPKSPQPGKTQPSRRKGDSVPSALPARGIYTLMGATGGVGTTSAACALAFDIARREQAARATKHDVDPRVALIDLDFDTGACAHHLDLLPSLSAEDITGPASRMDTTYVSALVGQSAAGVTLISAPNGCLGGQMDGRVNTRTVMAMLDALSQIFDYVVIDMPRQSLPWTLPVIAGSDVAMVLTELTVPSLHMARLRRAQVGAATQNMCELLPVLAKVERRAGRGGLRRQDARTALGCDPFGALAFDPEPLREALNAGEPLPLLRPGCAYMRDLRRLGDSVVAYAVEGMVDTEATAQAA